MVFAIVIVVRHVLQFVRTSMHSVYITHAHLDLSMKLWDIFASCNQATSTSKLVPGVNVSKPFMCCRLEHVVCMHAAEHAHSADASRSITVNDMAGAHRTVAIAAALCAPSTLFQHSHTCAAALYCHAQQLYTICRPSPPSPQIEVSPRLPTSPALGEPVPSPQIIPSPRYAGVAALQLIQPLLHHEDDVATHHDRKWMFIGVLMVSIGSGPNEFTQGCGRSFSTFQ
jgi:hypothetical protein